MALNITIDLDALSTLFGLQEASVLALIDYFNIEEAECRETNATFANLLGISESKVSETIQKLQKAGIIERTSYDGRNRSLRRKVEWDEIKNHISELEQSTLFQRKIKSVEDLKGKDKTLSDNVKQNLLKVVTDQEVIENLCKWIDVLYSLGKGITTTQMYLAVDELKRLSKDSAEIAVDIIKKATLNGYRDFKYCVDYDKNGNPKFTKQQWQTIWHDENQPKEPEVEFEAPVNVSVEKKNLLKI